MLWRNSFIVYKYKTTKKSFIISFESLFISVPLLFVNIIQINRNN